MNNNSQDRFSFPYVLDHKPGFFLSGFLYRLFKKVSVDENMKESLKQIQKSGTVVYAVKYRGQLDYLLYHFNFRRKRLPYPKIAFDLNMSLVLPLRQLFRVALFYLSSLFKNRRLPDPYQSGFYRDALNRRVTSMVFLVDPKGFIKYFMHAEKDRLYFLLETQQQMDHPIFLVPQLILYKKTPEKDYASLSNIFFGFKDNPGVIRKIALFFRHHRQAFIDFGQPINLKNYLENQAPERPLQEMAKELRQTLIERIDGQKRIILGPIMKSRQQLKEIVLTDSGIGRKIEKIAQGNQKRRKQLRKKADEYFDEIAADYNIAYVQAFQRGLRWFWKKLFEGIDIDETSLAKVREWARRGPLIYIPSHKSHIDYLILNYVLFVHHMHIPRIAAGKNLLFWPMGHIFRRSGAFFIRRSFQGARLYAEVFNRYVRALLEEGHPIEFFIEGGRSRNGKLVFPKIGFLSILLEAQREGFCKDLIFVPTSITYDNIMEEKSYLSEIGGGRKEKESFKQFLNARRFLRQRYGKIYVQFNEPISLTEYLANSQPQHGKEVHRRLAFHLVDAINEVTLVTPLCLIATAILTIHRRGFYLSELMETATTLIAFLKASNAPLASTLNDPPTAIKEALSLLQGRKIIDKMEDALDREEFFYYVEEEKKIELEYYKNNNIHFFISHAFVAISLLRSSGEVSNIDGIAKDYAFLKDLLKNEFVFDEEEDVHEKILSCLNYFQKNAFIEQTGPEYNYKITKMGFDKLPIWAMLVKTFIESYWIAVRAVSHQWDKRKKEGDMLKRMNNLGNRFLKMGVIDHSGALSQLNFKNALHHLNGTILRSDDQSPEDPSRLEKLSELDQNLYEFSRYGH
ncbi:1-acyl-sn-glycerol-3-phosphate acyltransferase [Thermodesulfobacteriota bacterium]